MWNIKNDRLGFDRWGPILFLATMLPNFLWLALPSPNDVLRRASVTPVVDTIAQILQIAMAASLCLAVNTARDRMTRGYATAIATCIVLYYIGWGAYFMGIADPAAILDLCLAPCGGFCSLFLDEKILPPSFLRAALRCAI